MVLEVPTFLSTPLLLAFHPLSEIRKIDKAEKRRNLFDASIFRYFSVPSSPPIHPVLYPHRSVLKKNIKSRIVVVATRLAVISPKNVISVRGWEMGLREKKSLGG